MSSTDPIRADPRGRSQWTAEDEFNRWFTSFAISCGLLVLVVAVALFFPSWVRDLVTLVVDGFASVLNLVVTWLSPYFD